VKKGPEISTFIGLAIGVGAVLGAMHFKHVKLSAFNNPAALLIILAGTVACIVIAFPGSQLKEVGKLFKIVFTKTAIPKHEDTINMIVEAAKKARQDGFVAMEGYIGGIENPFFAKGLQMLVDGIAQDEIVEIMENEISALEERHATGASVFAQACAYAPTLGVLGAVFGLIAAMSFLDDTEEMSHAIAAAFMATILGIFTGYVVWGPFANKLKVKSKEEVAVMNMVLVGVVQIQKGVNPMTIRDALIAMIPTKMQKKLMDKR
jgi:chemotaxis protein MotA